jgi:hypothetical protein
MILFSTLPHQRATPLWPAGTITKVPHKMIKTIKIRMAIPMVLGFGPLNSKASTVLSGIIHLQKEFSHVLQLCRAAVVRFEQQHWNTAALLSNDSQINLFSTKKLIEVWQEVVADEMASEKERRAS